MSLWDRMASGASTVARAWAVTRRDGATLGFTDHDRALAFDGIEFRPDAGLSASAVVSGTGLAVDNAEAMGALSSDAIAAADVEAGRYDGAGVRLWLVDWADPSERQLRFAGTLGEIRREGAAFHAELRGLAEALNRPLGRLYQPTCAATLGDAACGVDLVPFSAEVAAGPNDGTAFRLAGLGARPERWWEGGRLLVLSGAAQGLSGTIRLDRPDGADRLVELWAPLPPIAPADRLRVTAGCDRRAETCRTKFANMTRFRGFPHIPGEDWLLSVPTSAGVNDGGGLR